MKVYLPWKKDIKKPLQEFLKVSLVDLEVISEGIHETIIRRIFSIAILGEVYGGISQRISEGKFLQES